MKIINILIPIETAPRELLSKVYLCHFLALKGFRCYLGNKLNINHLMKCMKEYIYIDKGYHKDVSEKVYDIIKKNNGTIVSLDEEGGVDYADNSTLLGRYAPTLFENVYFTFFWGSEQYNLVKHHMSNSTRSLITGHPRFELLKPEFHNLYQEEVDDIKQRFPNFILINTNMGFGNNIKGDEFVKTNYSNRFKNIEQRIAFDKNKLGAYQSLILHLARIGKTIVVRPHPEENKSFYIDTFKGYSNVRVIYEGSVIPWLLASDLMIHPDCTTAIESLFIGKRALSYLPDEYPQDLVTMLPLDASLCFVSENDLIKYIKNEDILNDEKDLKQYPFVENFFSYSKQTTELIVNQINQIGNGYINSYSYDLSFISKVYLYYKVLRAGFSGDTSSRKLRKNKQRGLSYSAVNKIHIKLCNSNHTFCEVNLKKINKSLYCLFNEKQ